MTATRKIQILPLAVAGVLLIGAIVFATVVPQNPNDRMIKGKRLSSHLITAFAPGPKTNLNVVEAHQAIAEAGTNCLPLLAEWMRMEASPTRVKIGKRLSAAGVQTTLFPPEELPVLACKAAMALGNGLAAITPDLVVVCTNKSDRVANIAAQVLLMIQVTGRIDSLLEDEFRLRESLAVALEVLKRRAGSSPGSSHISERIRLLGGIQDRLRARIPDELLVIRLKQTKPEAQMRSARVLSRRGEAYLEVKPVLWEHLGSTNALAVENAVICLKNYGEKASDSIVLIEKLFSHSDEKVRLEATNALSRIRALQNGSSRLSVE
jgi:hypothetical protein